MMPEPQVDYDSAWKEVLERYFEEFTAFFFPQAHAEIDWTMGHEFLDKELQQVVRDAELRRRLADKLVKVWSRDGEEAWVLVHVEVQGGVEREFAKRMYVYNTRRTQKCLMSPVSNAGASNKGFFKNRARMLLKSSKPALKAWLVLSYKLSTVRMIFPY
jgi:hypothetical protein